MKTFFSLLIGAGMVSLGGCATLSEQDCATLDWSARGYQDGANGKTLGKFSDYSETCSEFGLKPDWSAYEPAYEEGLTRYCTYDKGFYRGRNGQTFKDVCPEPLVANFAQGYEDGRLVYAIEREHKNYIQAYEETIDKLAEVNIEFEQDGLTSDYKKSLERKRIKYRQRLKALQNDIRDIEYQHNLPRYDF